MATVKKPGPPVPPRPQHTNATASLLKAQRESFVNSFNRSSPTKSPTTPPANANPIHGRLTAAKEASAQPAPLAASPPVLSKKPTLPSHDAGRTIIYKSPSMTLQNKPQIAVKTTPAPRPPLKARKAPDVPTAAKPKVNGTNGDGGLVAPTAVNLNRHHSMGAAKTASGPSLKDAPPRLSLGRADFEKVSHKIHLDQLQPALPLPKPRKIVQMPVATLDLDDDEEQKGTTTGSSTFYTSTPVSAANASISTSNPTGMKIFRRSKTTLDNLASRVSVTTIATSGSSASSNGSGGGSGGFLGGKTVELKNNLKNAAERLFSELIVSQQKQQHLGPAETGQGTLMITKHERAIQHQAVADQQKELEKLQLQQQQQKQQHQEKL